MSVIKIVCQNCGAKYQLPESFKADKAKCKACQAAIDVASQREAATAPAAAPGAQPLRSKAQPATAKAKPAEVRAAAEPRRAKAGAASPRSRRTKHGDGAEDAGGGGRHGRRGERAAKKQGMSPAVIGGILGGIAVLVVGGIFLFGGGGEDPKKDDTAGVKLPIDPKPKVADADTPKPDAGIPLEAAGTAEPDPKAAVQPKPPAETPKKDVLESTADVFDPKTLEALSYPDDVAQEKRDEVEALLDDAVEVGLAGTRAKRKLEAIGYAALFGIVNRLRTFDYTSHDGLMSAWEFNRLIETITHGTNADFSVPIDEPSLEDMDKNAKTVKAWQGFLGKYPTEEAFKAWLKAKLDSREKNG